MIDLITGFLDCFCQVLYEFVMWDWKIAMISFLLAGHLLGRNQQAPEPIQSSYSTR